MNTYAAQNMIKRWNGLADCEKYGSDPAEVAAEIADMMKNLVEEGHVEKLTVKQESLLHGFQIETGFYAPDGFILKTSLDIHCVEVEPEMIEELDSFFMDYEINGCSFFRRLHQN